MSSDVFLDQAFPEIPWDEPVAVTLGDVSGYACRRCIAQKGLKGTDLDRLMATPEAVREHLRTVHMHQVTSSPR